MRWSLWLAQPETERLLGMTLRITVAAVALWTLAAAYGVWSTHIALAAAQQSVLSKSTQMSEIERALPNKRRAALKAGAVEVISSQGAGSAEITVEFADLARSAGAEVRGVQIGDSGQAGMAAQSGPKPAKAGDSGANASPAPAASAGQTAQAPAGSDAGTSETFECNVLGEYPALTRFLSALAASRHILEITSLQVTRGNAKTETSAPRLEMKISGTIYETAGNQ